jgi:polyisoprenoid-binding protein YceI
MTTTQPTVLAAGQWQVEPAESTATFRVGNFGRTVLGTVPMLEGTVEIDEDGTPSAVKGTLDISAIATGNARRDKDLRKPRLLDLDNYPVMTFTARRIYATPEGWHVSGLLTVRGIMTPVAGEVRLSTADLDMATLTATAQYDRKPMGIHAPRIMIGRTIEITVTATIRRCTA